MDLSVNDTPRISRKPELRCWIRSCDPAVEAQATDRAHRIGQENVVTSIKLIARDTVEHRVIAMQEKKRALISSLLDSESALPNDEDLSELIG